MEVTAQKRMFSLRVVDTDKFLDMPTSAQALYFHLGMNGDDDGFVSSPRKILRSVGCNDDDLRLLAAKGFLIPFESGVVVITDWKINNTIKTDRYTPTIYEDEKGKLQVESTGRYYAGTGMEPVCTQSGSIQEPHISIDKISKEEDIRTDKPSTRQRFVPPTADEVRLYCGEKGYSVQADSFVDYYTSNGWKVGKNPMKDWKAAVRTWSRKNCSDRNDINRGQRYTLAPLEDPFEKAVREGEYHV